MGNISKTNLFSPGKNSVISPLYKSDKVKHSSSEAGYQAAKLRRMANSAKNDFTDKKTVQSKSSLSIFNSAYTDSLREARAKKKDTGLSMKKLQYDFKKVSSEIIRSKTSTAAKSAASKARRETLRLKRLKASGEYDSEEIEAAITHAKSMERIAKKKAAHLEQEEMIKVTDKGDASLSLGDALKAESKKNSSDETGKDSSDITNGNISSEYSEDDFPAASEQMQTEIQAQQELAQKEAQAMQEELAYELSENMEEMMSELSDEMQEMMENFDMMEMLSGPVGKMSSDDFEMLKTKHRTDEMKEIAKADKEYLKVIFDKLQREKAGTAFKSAAPGNSAIDLSFGSPSHESVSEALSKLSINMPASSVGSGAGLSFSGFEGAAIDVSV